MRLLIAISFGVVIFPLFGQVSFFNLYSDSGDDFGEGIVQLEDSSYVITGSSSSFGSGPADAFLLKIDSLGNYLWSRNYGGAESDGGRRVMYKPGDGFYVAGTTNSFGNGAYDFYLFKTDLNGNLLWEKTYGGSGWEKLNDAVLTSDDHIIFVGETSSNPLQDRESMIMKLDLSGDSIFSVLNSRDGDDFYSSITYFHDTLFAVTSQLYDLSDLKWKSALSMFKLDGAMLWSDTISINGDCKINDLTYSSSELFLVGGMNTPDQSSFGSLRIKYDLTGNQIIQNSTSSSFLEYDKDICPYGNSGTFIISFEYEDELLPGNGLDLAIWKYNFPFTNLNQWTPVPYINDDKIGQTIKTSDNSVVSVGTTSSNNQAYNNVFVSKIGPGSIFPNATAPHNTQQLVGVLTLGAETNVTLYPNPTSGSLNISSDSLWIEGVSVLNLRGEIVLTSIQSKIDVSSLTPGVYIVSVETENGITKKRLVIQ